MNVKLYKTLSSQPDIVNNVKSIGASPIVGYTTITLNDESQLLIRSNLYDISVINEVEEKE